MATHRLVALKEDDASTFVTSRQVVSSVVKFNGRNNIG